MDRRGPRHGERTRLQPQRLRRGSTPTHRQNPAVEDIYEPGSTFKTVTASAALEERLLTPETLIDCAPGYIDIGRRRVQRRAPERRADVHRRHREVEQRRRDQDGLQGRRRAARALRAPLRVRHAHAAGPARPSRAGIVWSQLSDSALASVSMGYQIGVTPLQMATAVSSIANGGELMRPRLVRAIDPRRRAPAGGARGDPPDGRAPETAATLTTIMEGVVERGTAKPAQIDGYTIAGKTGTAAQADQRRVLEAEVLLVVRRVHAVAQAGHHRARDDRHAARGRRTTAAWSPRRSSSASPRSPSATSAFRARSIPRQPVVVAPQHRRSAPARTVTYVPSSPSGGNGGPGRRHARPARPQRARRGSHAGARRASCRAWRAAGSSPSRSPMAGTPLDPGTSVAAGAALERQPPPPPADTASHHDLVGAARALVAPAACCSAPPVRAARRLRPR